MESLTLDTNLISDPRLWRLSLALSENELNVLIYSAIGDSADIACKFSLDGKGFDFESKKLENIVYDNQLLLQDFDAVKILVRTESYTLVPQESKDDEINEQIIFREIGENDKSVIVDELPLGGVNVVTAIDTLTLNFLRRSFRAKIHNWVYPLCCHFIDRSRVGNGKKMFAFFKDKHIDLIAADGGNILMANSFEFHNVNDIIYFVIAARKSLSFDNSTDALYLSGDVKIREALAPVFREYIANVMPVIFPPALQKSISQSNIDIPFPLLLTQICE